MGYTTKFVGAFTLSKLPAVELILLLNELAEGKDRSDGSPEGYCQWQFSKDFKRLEWDGNEKFYHYAEWLQWLISHPFEEAGIEVTGSVKFSGEDIDDRGIIEIKNGRVVKSVQPLVLDDVAELRRFRDWVLGSSFAEEVKDGWVQHNKG